MAVYQYRNICISLNAVYMLVTLFSVSVSQCSWCPVSPISQFMLLKN